jgi:predicted RNA-binding Zn ribbon-like protein
LDFVNSVKFRGREAPGERLVSFDALVAWCETAQILTKEEATVLSGQNGANALRLALSLRESFRAFLDAPHDPARCAQLESKLARAKPKLRLDPHTGRVRHEMPVAQPEDLVRRLEAEIADFLTDWNQTRTRECAADDCDWVFVDRTKPGRRKWCDTRTCGNRDRVRRHREGSAE